MDDIEPGICEVAECHQSVDPDRTLCRGHIRRAIDGLVYENDDGLLVDHCIRHHELLEYNIRWEAFGNRGGKRRRCRECLRIKAKNQAKRALPVVETPKPYRPEDLTLTRAIEDFEEAKSKVTGKCAGDPGPWMDWEAPPTAEKAAELCSGCPLAKACRNYALAAKETHGVWGGLVISEGQILSRVRKES